ncbi:hypothetical protein CTI14_71485, partial [Methylobacterium radiotolerans]
TEDEIRQHRRSSGYIGAQTRQILPSRGKIGDDTRADALTEDEIRQHRRSSGYIGAQTRQILPSRGKIGDD